MTLGRDSSSDEVIKRWFVNEGVDDKVSQKVAVKNDVSIVKPFFILRDRATLLQD